MSEPMLSTTTKYAARWELAGTVFVVLAGSAMHFVYDWTGQWRPVALVAAVNESVWEHLKLAFWPYLAFAAIEWPFLRSKTNNFWTAKAAGALSMPIAIVAGFYSYTAIAGTNYLVADIALFVIAVAFGHAASLSILVRTPISRSVRTAAAAALIVQLLAFAVFTYRPPQWPLFRDPVHGHYGIEKAPVP